MTDKLKLPTRLRRVVQRCENGEVVCVSIRHSDVGDERAYWFEPSGASLGLCTFEKAMSKGLIAPNGDGLFGDSQTYGLPR